VNDLDQYRTELISEVNAYADVLQTFKREAFTEYVLNELVSIEEIPDFQICYYENRVGRSFAEMDAYQFDDNDGSLYLFISLYNEENNEPITNTIASNLYNRLEKVVEAIRLNQIHPDIAHPIDSLISELARRFDQNNLTETETPLSKVKLYILSSNKRGDRFNDVLPPTKLQNLSVEYHIWDIERLRTNLLATSQEAVEINITELLTPGIPTLQASKSQTGYDSFLCVVPGYVLADLYIKYGSKLLEGNVRSYLTTSKKVNKGIKNTVLNEPGNFFAYNNGISATASKISVVPKSGGLYITHIENLQIVNGAQTTATLAECRLSSEGPKMHIDGKVFVQMKLSVVHRDEYNILIPKISRFSNSQNAVSEADFFANHPYHVAIEQLSHSNRAPASGGQQYETYWYYERLRAQYQNDILRAGLKTERERYKATHPKEQLITKTDLAKVLNCWNLEPHFVSRGAQTNFVRFATKIVSEWNSDSTHAKYNQVYFRDLVAKTIIFRSTQVVVTNQSWYEQGYRANIVAYSIAKLVSDIKKYFPTKELDLNSIWKNQCISDVLKHQLSINAKQAFDVIMNPPRAAQNIGQWTKQEACWKRLDQLEPKFTPSFELSLIDKDEVASLRNEARTDQKFVNGVVLLTNFLTIRESDPRYFEKLMSFIQNEGIKATAQERAALAKFLSSTKIPSEKDALEVDKILEKAKALGFLDA